MAHSGQIKIADAREWAGGASYGVSYEDPDLQKLAENENVRREPYRVATVAYGGLHPTFADAYGLESVDGYAVLYPFRYQEFWGKVIDLRL